MRKKFPVLFCLAFMLAMPSLQAATPKKTEVSTRKTTKKSPDTKVAGKSAVKKSSAKGTPPQSRSKQTLSRKKGQQATLKTPAKKSVAQRKEVVSKAIANARRTAPIQQVSAVPSTLYSANSPNVQSSGVLVINERSGQIIYEKNAYQVAPIASISKIMTAMVTLDAHLPMNEKLTITEDDIDHLKKTSSRLTVGTELTRAEMLLLALMSSENRAASALSRNYPGGQAAFVQAMNQKAKQLGMQQSRFYEPTGLNSANVSTPHDLALMVAAAHHYPEIHQFSTSMQYSFISNITGKELIFRTTNPLIRNDNWNIGISKTGYISEAGQCLVMQAMISNAPVVIILLDSAGKQTRVADAQRIRTWIESDPQALLNAG